MPSPNTLSSLYSTRFEDKKHRRVAFFWLYHVVPGPIHWVHAYANASAEWKGCLYLWSFPRLGAYAGASAEFFVGWSCKSQIITVNLPPRLCLRNKNPRLRACLRTPRRSAKYQVNSLRSFIRSSLEYITLVIKKKNDAQEKHLPKKTSSNNPCSCNVPEKKTTTSSSSS